MEHGVYAVVECPSVCPSVTSWYCIETTGGIELVFGMEASFYIPHSSSNRTVLAHFALSDPSGSPRARP